MKPAINLTMLTPEPTRKPAIFLNMLATFSNRLFPPIFINSSFALIITFSRATALEPDLNKIGAILLIIGAAGLRNLVAIAFTLLISTADNKLSIIENQSFLYNEIIAERTFATISIGKPAQVNGTIPITSRTRRMIFKVISVGSGSATMPLMKLQTVPSKLSSIV